MLSLTRRSTLRNSVAIAALVAAGTVSSTVHAQTRNFNLPSQLRGGAQHGSLETVTPVAAPAGTSVVPAAPPPAQAEPVMDEIVVTGSRIVRDGFEAPTPLTVVGTEEIAAASRVNIADFVSTLPSFSGAVSPHGGNQTSDGRQGQSNLSTRGLGATRTLVLLDGHRVASSDINGTTNISDLPQALVARVDVVTGGASAAYGSDALAGVVNFILDKEFIGVKGDIAGSVSTYGDNGSFKGALSFGRSFANGRGHLLISGDLADTPGFNGDKREWNRLGWRIMSNPAYAAGNGQPQFIIRDKVGLSNGAPGGLIVSGPLKGIYWGPGGAPAQLNWGAVAGTFMVGGDWTVTDASQYVSIENNVRRKSLYVRASYELSDSVEIYAQYIFGNSNAAATTAPHFNLANITIQAGNPYLTPAIATQMSGLGLTSFVMGSLHADLPGVHSDGLGTVVDRRLYSYSGGASGSFDAAGSEWNWDIFMARDLARSDTVAFTTILPRVTQASDAVRNPTTGTIVCRSTLTNPSDGCVPYNPMGIGVNSAAAIDWITGESTLYRRIKQQAYAASASGEPFDSWAGPISIAFGLEHRKTSAAGEADAFSLARVYQVGNFQPTFGSISVTEGFVETVVPLAKDTAWADSLEFNGAVRGTDYSTSGYVTTWKAGFTYRPNSEIMLRGTRSRDIRAPNIEELYLAGTTFSTPFLIDPFRNNEVIPTFLRTQEGNRSLVPEKADTTGVGIVYQPAWLAGLSGSVDLYDIEVKGAITTIQGQEVLDRCFSGNQFLCSLITRTNGIVTGLRLVPINLVTESTRGLDIELGYRTPVDNIVSGWDGDLSLRALGTRVFFRRLDTGIGSVIDTAGENSGGGPLDWRWLLTATYAAQPVSVSWTGRVVSSGVYQNSYRVCASGCPASTPLSPTIDSNHIPGRFYMDLSMSYDIMRTDEGSNLQAYLTITNITNRDPPVVASTTFFPAAANSQFYDLIGRTFYAGIRFRM